jgi:hypothetical protein
VGTQGLSLGVGMGISGQRFALSATPGLSFASAANGFQGLQSTSLSLALAARFYLRERREKELTGYLRPEVLFGFVSNNQVTISGAGNLIGFLGLGAAVGGEYLVTPRFGLTLELGLRALFTPLANAMAVDLNGSLGVMLHQ